LKSSTGGDASEDEGLTVAQLQRQIKQERDEASRTIQVYREKLRVAEGQIADAEKYRLLEKKRKRVKMENRKRLWDASAAGQAAMARRAEILIERQQILEERQFGPGPRCRFCLVLLNKKEWKRQRCLAHWSASIKDCPHWSQPSKSRA
jgi:hypothetical protein